MEWPKTSATSKINTNLYYHQTEFPTLANSERVLIMLALRVSKGNQAMAARMLNVERHRFYRMIRRHELETMVKA